MVTRESRASVGTGLGILAGVPVAPVELGQAARRHYVGPEAREPC